MRSKTSKNVIPSREVPSCIRRHVAFNLNSGSDPHLYARWEYPGPDEISRLYVVYSYGEHFPIFIFDPRGGEGSEGCWYGTKDKYSVTTSRHQSLCRPPNVQIWLDINEMRTVARLGFMSMMVRKVG